eukprot:Colp12_sorted_trinity150504_noHs@27318
MGQLFVEFLSGNRVFVCTGCNIHLSKYEEIVSKDFHGAHGRAYLFMKVINVHTGQPQDRQMTTGLHTVTDVYCNKCGTTLGWKYEKAYEESQRYKEGLTILERALIDEIRAK